MQLFSLLVKRLVPGVLLALACMPLFSTQAQPDSLNEFSTTGQTVVVQTPTLTPAYTTQCDSGWHAEPYEPGKTAYLALNVQNSGDADHSGIWRPSITAAGLYRVEVFIPDHGSIPWQCDINKTITSDTTNANYTIHHRDGQTKVVVDQKPIQSAWVSLGEYYFASGTGGLVSLNNATGEAAQTSLVSFSAARFTSLERVHLPLINNGQTGVAIDLIYTADSAGNKQSTFAPSDQMRYVASVSNTSFLPAPIKYTWSQKGPCAPTQLTSGSFTAVNGSSQLTFDAAAPACRGDFTVTLEYEIAGVKASMVSKFTTGSYSVFPAFDKCGPPSTTNMQKWWDSSPYGTKNLYIGGISYACKNTILNKSWVETVSNQGWSFILTWVGPQASCTSFTHRMSENSSTAFQQGKDEADKALAAARNLGFVDQPVIYYDLEGYYAKDYPKCHKAALEFLRGWTQRLHAQNALSGIYGGCLSKPADWATLSPAPDRVWLANWIQPYAYNPNASVWNVYCANNSLWPNHQRIRQYTGGHIESWGGVEMTIDSNAVDSPMVGSANLAAAGSSGAELSTPREWSHIQAMQWLSPGMGWVLSGEELVVTRDAGAHWLPAALPPGSRPLAAHFVDTSSGWVLAADPAGDRLELFKTIDGAQTWEALPHLTDLAAMEIERADLQALDGQLTAITLKIATGSGVSQAALLTSPDGGQSWQQSWLPFSGKVNFVNAHTGFLAEGPLGNELYRTLDGGVTWEPVAFSRPDGQPQDQIFIKSPEFDPTQGMIGRMEVTVSNAEGSSVELYTTSDLGEHWILEEAVPLAREVEPAQTVPSALLWKNNRHFLPQAMLPANAASAETRAYLPIGMPDGVQEIVFLDERHGWAWGVSGVCSGSKLVDAGSSAGQPQNLSCAQNIALWRTSDGGVNWVEVLRNSAP